MTEITFLSPVLLGFAIALPLLWWLLRLMPPSPQKVMFPALALLQGLVTHEQTPARTPWWLLLLRLLISALLIVGFAQPLIDPQPIASGHGNLLIVVDNDWAAARNWDTRKAALHDLLHRAARENRNIYLLLTAHPANGDAMQMIGPLAAKSAAGDIDRIKPQPWASDWRQALELLHKLDHGTQIDSIWLSSGLGDVDTKSFFEALGQTGSVKVLGDADNPIYDLMPPQSEGDDIVVAVQRAVTDRPASVNVVALGSDGQTLAHLPITFTAGSPRATAPLNVPLDIRNQITQFEIEGQHSAATTALLDASWQHRPVGLVGDAGELAQHSLLSDLFYIDRALKPYADIHVDSLDKLLAQKMAVIILTDTEEFSDDDILKLEDWVKHGGILVRFAGDHLATVQNGKGIDLLPVPLRTGDRAMGGTLSWATPQKLRVFPDKSPFFGLSIPDDVTINRQILAEPSADLTARSWANLNDGTPLVTAKPLGRGLSVLFHVPARSDWSNLPLSGLFVDMLRRIIDLSHGVPADGSAFSTLPPLRILDAFGEDKKPDTVVQPISADDFASLRPGPQHPPGIYGSDALNRAFNLGPMIGQPNALKDILTEDYHQDKSEIDLQPYLLCAAFILLLLDFIISLWLRGILVWRGRKAIASIGLVLLVLTLHPAQAADDRSAVELTSKTYLAYVRTGDRELDTISEAGLTGLANILQRRTSIDQLGVVGVDPASDELGFFSLLYWPLSASEVPLSPQAAAHVNDYLHHGGMILFDTMNGESLPPAVTQRLLAGLDLPPLTKLPQDHVLKHSFYLLDEFPGRYNNSDFWLEPEELSSYDGVATVLSGTNGWAAAWALDKNGRPMFPCTPGGEIQRERAFRFGVNLMMYALTGNYKSDQLHAQTLLQRLGK